MQQSMMTVKKKTKRITKFTSQLTLKLMRPKDKLEHFVASIKNHSWFRIDCIAFNLYCRSGL
ncbi:CLUMA_CG002875, isoform A [Clunio marinus]|uniref:CLUMA_CG002875, isoform A n=1 Tax=Clunio marinus TaxID=568069 RepID=A0A1J1HL56_9DIPT|nr:CLUMA_CG002875, isoform A [Clunio marinus]